MRYTYPCLHSILGQRCQTPQCQPLGAAPCVMTASSCQAVSCVALQGQHSIALSTGQTSTLDCMMGSNTLTSVQLVAHQGIPVHHNQKLTTGQAGTS